MVILEDDAEDCPLPGKYPDPGGNLHADHPRFTAQGAPQGTHLYSR